MRKPTAICSISKRWERWRVSRRRLSSILILMVLSTEPAFAGPSPINPDFADTAILAQLPNVRVNTAQPPSSPEALASQVHEYIRQARSTGDPRFIGYAEGILSPWPENRMTDELRVLRATLYQSQHKFDKARTDLRTVIQQGHGPQRLQALLTLANVQTVQGRYNQARTACQQLQQAMPGLISQSCLALVDARTGQASEAYQTLLAGYRQARGAATSEQLWALGTLGDLADQLDNDKAEQYWREVLLSNPDDLYIRAELADWYLRHHRAQPVLALTRGYEKVDSLAVLRAIAMRRLDHPDAPALVQRLRERFSEARWRGSMLHKRDYARFQLHVENDPELALEFALANWKTQREPPDTRLLLLAAQEAGQTERSRPVRQWLTSHHQTDARYPGDTP